MQFFVYANKSTPWPKNQKKMLPRLKNAITFLLLVAKECPLNHEILTLAFLLPESRILNMVQQKVNKKIILHRKFFFIVRTWFKLLHLCPVL